MKVLLIGLGTVGEAIATLSRGRPLRSSIRWARSRASP